MVEMIRFYCDSCGEHQPVDIEPLTADELNRPMAWGDIVCRKCHFVIATMSCDENEAGIYKVVQVESFNHISWDELIEVLNDSHSS